MGLRIKNNQAYKSGEEFNNYNTMFDMFRYEPVQPRRVRRRSKLSQLPPNKKILLVDDSVKAITPLNVIFRNFGCETTIAFDGNSAVNEIVLNRPDLIVLDWNMPDVTGGEAILKAQTKFILEELASGKLIQYKIPIITFSAYPFADIDRPDCPNFNFLDHWQKPLSFRELTINAARLLSER